MPLLSSIIALRILSFVPLWFIGHAAAQAPHDRQALNSGEMSIMSCHLFLSVE